MSKQWKWTLAAAVVLVAATGFQAASRRSPQRTPNEEAADRGTSWTSGSTAVRLTNRWSPWPWTAG